MGMVWFVLAGALWLPGAAPQDEVEVSKLVVALGSDDLAEREAAAAELRKRGAAVVPALKREVERAKDADVATRLRGLIAELGRPSFELERELRVRAASAAWAPDGRTLVVAGVTGGLSVYEPGAEWRERKVGVKGLPEGRVHALALSPDGRTAALAHDRGVASVRVADGEARTVVARESGAAAVAFVDGERLLFAEPEGTGVRVSLTSLEGAVVGQTMSGVLALRLTLSCDGTLALTGGSMILLLDGRRLMARAVVPLPQSPVGGGVGTPRGMMAFSADGRSAAYEGWGGAVAVASVEPWTVQATWRPHGRDGLPALGFTPDGRWLVSAGADGRLRAWGVKGDWTREAASIECGPTGARLVVVVAPSGGRVAVLGDGDCESVRVYRLREP